MASCIRILTLSRGSLSEKIEKGDEGRNEDYHSNKEKFELEQLHRSLEKVRTKWQISKEVKIKKNDTFMRSDSLVAMFAVLTDQISKLFNL